MLHAIRIMLCNLNPLIYNTWRFRTAQIYQVATAQHFNVYYATAEFISSKTLYLVTGILNLHSFGTTHNILFVYDCQVKHIIMYAHKADIHTIFTVMPTQLG